MSDSRRTSSLQNNVIRVHHHGQAAGSSSSTSQKAEINGGLNLACDLRARQINTLSGSSKCPDLERHGFDPGMPATTSTSFNQVPRMQMAAAPSFQDLALLPYQMASYPMHQGLFFYSGFDVLRGPTVPPPQPVAFNIKEETRFFDRKGHEQHDGLVTATTDSRATPEAAGEAIDIKESIGGDSYCVGLKREALSPPLPRKSSVRRSELKNPETVADNNGSPSSAMMRISNFAINENHGSRNRQQQQIQHPGQVLHFSSANCSDALLSASAVIGYGDDDIMQESAGFNGTLEDSLLSGGGGRGTNSGDANSDAPMSTTYDLFEGNTHDSYAGNAAELRLSPHTFSDGSNLSIVTSDQITDNVLGNGSDGDSGNRSQDANKLSVPPSLVDKAKSLKSRPSKASSPNRTGSQTCQVCGKVFSNSSALAKHKLTHSDERKYVCQLCTKAFKRQDHLNGHLLTHMNKKPYECKVDGCGKSYCDARSLRRHTENHHSSLAAAASSSASPVAPRIPASLPFNTGESATKLTGVTLNGAVPMGNGPASRLANALQSNRICYAPPPPPPPPPAPVVQITSNVLQSALSTSSLNFQRTSSPSTSNAATTSSSAANQLQILAFQQHEQRTGPQPGTSLLSWQLQQPPRGGQIGSMLDDYLGLTAAATTTPATTSVLAQHLRMTVPQSVPVGGSSSSSSSGGQLTLDAMAPQEQQQWIAIRDNPSSGGGIVRQVECSICQRKFKNTPALNGHMRLHGGYFRKESVEAGGRKATSGDDRYKSDGHSSSPTAGSLGHPPLQTASVNIRALIEEKIIQKRIVNPAVNSASSIPTPPPSLDASIDLRHMDILNYSDAAAGLPHLQQPAQQSPPQPLPQLMELAVDEVQHRPLRSDEDASRVHLGEHEQQQQQPADDEAEEYVRESDSRHPSPSVHHQVNPDDNMYDVDPMLMSTQATEETAEVDDAAQSDMQRQIEIIKQGLMAHQHVAEKFRRHSDSDHFLAPRRTPFGPAAGYAVPDFFSVGALAEFFHREKLVGKRMQRTGSDPGEFGVSDEMPDDDDDDDVNRDDALLPDEVVDAMELPDNLQVGEALPPPDMMDFEVDTENLTSTLETTLLASALSDGTCSVVNDGSVYGNYKPEVSEPIAPDDDDDDVDGLGLTTVLASAALKVKMDEDDDVFLSPSSIPTSPIRSLKKKHRPEPLFIPPQVNACGFQSRLRSPRLWDPSPSVGGGGGAGGGGTGASGVTAGFGGLKPPCSPPPYTPPPMLSPLRCGSGLFWHVLSASGSMTPKSTPLTPGRQGLAALNGFPPSECVLASPLEAEVEIDEPPETDILPHVNIGPQFQARLPLFRPHRDRTYNPNVDDLVWDPRCEESVSDKEVENYLQFACCAAVPGGGINKEYALHVLRMASGDIQEAMLRLMDPVPKLSRNHPLLDYQYAESDKWSAEEIDSYQQALMTFDKDFLNISLELKTKSVKQCVQFYYLWKKVCPDEYRRLRTLRRRRELQDGLPCGVRGAKPLDGIVECVYQDPCQADSSPGKPGDSSVDRYACDHPDCFASFSTRQALNGHVRVHGHNVTNGSRSRSRSPTRYGVDPPSEIFDGATQQFPCKVCGKVFSKVKSRSAHMKSHRPIDSSKAK